MLVSALHKSPNLLSITTMSCRQGYSQGDLLEEGQATHSSNLGVAQLVKNPPAMRKNWVRSLGWKDPLEKGTVTHSNILASVS